MEANDWQRVRALFEAALERPEGERRAFLEAEAEGPVRDEALALLDADGRDHSLLDGDGVGQRLDRLFSPEGTRVGPYRVLERIGEGGMGAVHLGARDDGQFEQHVALKLLRPGLAPARLLERFTEERRILARLEHANIARLLDGGITDAGQPWFAMEYVDGQPLGRWCDAQELSVEQRLRLFLTVCDAVRYAHSRLVVHRDLKPDNILVAEDERGRPVVKLLDFGIAKLLEGGHAGLTRTEGPPLTPAYASPEQVAGEAVSTATDVYSLGVVLYELLTGQRPYHPEPGSAMELALAIRTAEPERPSTTVRRAEGEAARLRGLRRDRLERRLAGDLDVICLQALRKEPERRYGSVEALREDLLRHLEGRPVLARGDTLAYRTRKFVGRNRGAVLSAATVALSVLVLAVSSAVQSVRLEAERDAARLERDRAQAVADFLAEVFRASDPAETLGAETSARELLDRGARRIVQGDTLDPDLRATLLQVMGEVYTSFQLVPAAVPLYEAVLEHAQGRWPAPSAEVLRARAQLGAALGDAGDFERGRQLLAESVRELELLGDTVDPLTRARTYNRFGRLELGAGRYEGAAAHFERALALVESESSVESELGSVLLNNLGQLSEATGRYEEAVAYHRRALALREDRLDPLHPSVLTSLNNLALALDRLDRFDEATGIFGDLVRRSEQAYGPSPALGLHLNNAASAWKRWGKPKEAEPLQRRALALFREHLGDDHRYVAMGYNNLANLMHDQGRPAAAAELHRRALAMNRRIYGEEHDRTAGSLNNLAAALRDLGELDEAVALYRETIALDRRLLGDEHPFVATDRVNLASALTERGGPGDFAAARAELDVATALQTEHLPPDAPTHALRLVESALLHLRTGDPVAAEADARRAVEHRARHSPGASARTAYGQAVLGATLLARGEADAALALLDPAHERLVEFLGPDARHAHTARTWLEEARSAKAAGPPTEAGAP